MNKKIILGLFVVILIGIMMLPLVRAPEDKPIDSSGDIYDKSTEITDGAAAKYEKRDTEFTFYNEAVVKIENKINITTTLSADNGITLSAPSASSLYATRTYLYNASKYTCTKWESFPDSCLEGSWYIDPNPQNVTQKIYKGEKIDYGTLWYEIPSKSNKVKEYLKLIKRPKITPSSGVPPPPINDAVVFNVEFGSDQYLELNSQGDAIVKSKSKWTVGMGKFLAPTVEDSKGNVGTAWYSIDNANGWLFVHIDKNFLDQVQWSKGEYIIVDPTWEETTYADFTAAGTNLSVTEADNNNNNVQLSGWYSLNGTSNINFNFEDFTIGNLSGQKGWTILVWSDVAANVTVGSTFGKTSNGVRVWAGDNSGASCTYPYEIFTSTENGSISMDYYIDSTNANSEEVLFRLRSGATEVTYITAETWNSTHYRGAYYDTGATKLFNFTTPVFIPFNTWHNFKFEWFNNGSNDYGNYYYDGVQVLANNKTIIRNAFTTLNNDLIMVCVTTSSGTKYHWDQFDNFKIYKNNAQLYNLTGYYTSEEIVPGALTAWDTFAIAKTEYLPANNITVDILNGSTNTTIAGYVGITASTYDISALDINTYPTLRIRANFYGNGTHTPTLDDWNVTWSDTSDVTAPSISAINSPASNTNISGNYLFNYTITDDTAVTAANIAFENSSGNFSATGTLGWTDLPKFGTTDYFNITVTTTNLKEDTYRVWVNASDAVPNTAYNSNRIITIDNTLPSIVQIYNPATNRNISYYTFTYEPYDSGSGVAGGNISFGNATGNFSTSGTLGWTNFPLVSGNLSLTTYTNSLRDGTYQVWVNVSDNAGNFNYNDTRIVTTDNTNPSVTLNTPTSKWYNSNFVINATATDTTSGINPNPNYQWYNQSGGGASDTIVLSWDGSYVSTTFDISTLLDGNYTFNIRCADLAGNSNNSVNATNIGIDRVSPAITGIVSPSSNTNVTGLETLSYDWSDDRSGYAPGYVALGNSTGNFSLTGTLGWSTLPAALTPAGRFSASLDSTLLTEGTYTIWVNASDAAGNGQYNNTRWIVIDNSAPAITPVLTSGWNIANFVVNSSATDSISFVKQVHYRYHNISDWSVSNWQDMIRSGNYWYTSAPLNINNLQDGNYTFEFRAQNGALLTNFSNVTSVGIDHTLPTVNSTIVSPNATTVGTNIIINTSIYDSIGRKNSTAIIQFSNQTTNYTTISFTDQGSNAWNTTLNTAGMSIGTYLVDLLTYDIAGNIKYSDNAGIIALSTGAVDIYISSTNFTENIFSTITATNSISVSIVTSANVSGMIGVAEYNSSIVSDSSFSASTPVNKYVEIIIPSEIENNLTYAYINISYTDAEIAAAGLTESSLRIRRWDGSTWTEVSDSGVDTVNNYIWARVTSFSIYGGFGSPTTDSSESSSGSRSGFGEGYLFPEDGNDAYLQKPRPAWRERVDKETDSFETEENIDSEEKRDYITGASILTVEYSKPVMYILAVISAAILIIALIKRKKKNNGGFKYKYHGKY